MQERVTVLQAKAPLVLTKTFLADGLVKTYGDAKFYEVTGFKAANLNELSAGLTKLETMHRCCVIRGQFKGVEFSKAEHPDLIDGKYFARKKVLFDDVPRHYLMLDVDGFVTETPNPHLNPQAAAEEFIGKCLPECFHDVSFHWQLSASAGTAGKEHLLKMHLWFWLKTPYRSHELTAWAKAFAPAVDVAPLRTVQVHYTANPIFEDGVPDPVPVRSGLVQGLLDDEVDLLIDDVTIARAAEYQGAEEGYTFVDPADKPGPIGAFHRALTVEEVLERWLSDEFVMDAGSDRRVTWLNGGGTPGGCFITDDRKHFGSTHNTDPFDNRVVNLFDLVRHYVYGHLDENMDAFEILDVWDRPSYQACLAMVEALPEVQAEIRHGKAFRVENYRLMIEAATDAYALEQDVCPAIANDMALIDVERIQLAKIVQDKAHQLLGTKPAISVIREWLAPVITSGGFDEVNEAGYPLCTITNVRTLLHRLNGSIRYNVMTKEEELMLPGHSFSVDNKANASLAIVLSEAAGVQMATHLIKGHLLQIADENQYNPMMTWINSVPWDGVSRLHDLYSTLVVEPRLFELRNMLVRKWLLSAVYAAASPVGVAAQGMLVLTGKQYKGKTRWFKRLVGENDEMFREGVTLDPKDKDSVKIAVGAWITELGELDATFRKADIAALKAFITRQQDIFRKPFAPAESKFVRRTVFGGTVNDEAYLRDPTGNRRFYTLPVIEVHHNHDVDMQQLWAEVYETMYLKGEDHWLSPEWLERLNEHNEDHTEIDPLAELVVTQFDFEADKKGWSWMPATEACRMIGVSPDRGNATKVGAILGKLGSEKKKSNGVRSLLVPPLKSDFV